MAYLDFSLSRFRYTKLLTKEEWVPGTEDKEWHEYIELRYMPNPKLPPEIQKVIQEDYMLNDDESLLIHCRKAIAYYLKEEIESETIMSINKWVRAEE